MDLNDLRKLAAEPEKMARAIELVTELDGIKRRELEIVTEMQLLGLIPDTPEAVAETSSDRVVPLRRPVAPPAAPAGPQQISVPPEHKEFHQTYWAQGVEIIFLDNGQVVVAGKIVDIEQMRPAANAYLRELQKAKG